MLRRGFKPAAPRPITLILAARGRMGFRRASTASCATSCWIVKPLPPFQKPRCCWKRIGAGTMNRGCTVASTTCRPQHLRGVGDNKQTKSNNRSRSQASCPISPNTHFARGIYNGVHLISTQIRLKMKMFLLFLVALSLTLSSALTSSARGAKKADATGTNATSCGINFAADDYWLRGVTDRNRGQPGKAIKNFRKAISLDPNDWFFHVSLANLLYTQNLLPEAIVEMRQIVRLKPTLAYWHLRLGNTLNLIGQRVQARKEWQKVILLDGDGSYSDEAEKMLNLFAS